MRADERVRTYDPKEVIINFGGFPITGFMDGTFISVAPAEAKFETHKGADGGIDRVNKNSRNVEITITLKQTSISNDELSALHIADQNANIGVVPFLLKEKNGGTLVSAAAAWISETPTISYSESIESREWKISTGIAQVYTGGKYR